MTNLKNKKALFIGTGKMGLPALIGFIKSNQPDPTDITVITGNSAGKDIPAVCQALKENGISEHYIEQLNLFSREDITPETLEEFDKQDYVYLSVPPGAAKQTVKDYLKVFQGATLLVTSVASRSVKNYEPLIPMQVARIMPHIPQACYGFYSKNERAIESVAPLCKGLGVPIELKHEKQMHGFTAIVGSAPAFIAQFISHFENKIQQEGALNWLNRFATGAIDRNPPTHVEALVSEKCMEFYNNYLGVAKHYLGENNAQIAVNETLRSTTEDLQKGNTEYSEYIKPVRTPRGTTNVGLIFMGNPPPDDPAFGNSSEIVGQKAWAQKQAALFTNSATNKHAIPYSESIIYACAAAAKRSTGIAQDPDDPLYGAGLDLVKNTVKEIKQEMQAEKKADKRSR